MKLHRIRLRNYRGVRESEVWFAESGVTIVEGPNEIGKTSLPEALRLAFEYPDSSRRKKVEDVKPVDRDEGPEVEIELSTGRYSLVYLKRWRPRPTTTLRITAPQNENHTGREAHDRLEEILTETLDKDLWSALQIDQGTELKLPSFSIPSMRGALGSAAGGDASGADDDTLMDRIQQEYQKYWTPTGRVTGDRSTGQQQVEEARGEVEDLKARMAEIDKDVTTLSALVDEANRIDQTLKELGESELKLADAWEAIERMRTDLDRVDALHSAAASQRQQAFQEWSRREELKRELEACAKGLADLEGEADLAAPAFFAATGRSEETAASLRAATDALRNARDRHSRAFGDRDFRQDEIDVKLISERYERYLKAEKLLKTSEEYLESAKVDEKALDEIERAYHEDVRAQAVVESAAATVEATALSDIRLEVDGDEIELGANEAQTIRVEEQVKMVIPGVAQFKVSAAPEAKVLAERRRSAHETYRRLCLGVGVTDLREARRAEQERRDALRNRDEAREATKREVRDWTPEILRSRIASLTENVNTYPKQRPEFPPIPADLDEARRIATEAAGVVADCERESQSCGAASKEAEDHLNKAKIEHAELVARIDVARDRDEEASRRLTTAREGQSDEALSSTLAQAQQEFNVSLKRLEGVKAQLNDADPGSLEAQLENARNVKRRAIQGLQSNRDSQNQLKASLEIRGEKGLQGLQGQAEVRLRQAEREHDGTEARAKAAKLLKETFESHRRRAHQRYVQPFKERIDQFGRIVFGPTFEVELSEELEVVGRTLDGVTLDIGQLSTGAREQLGVLSRLACAAIVSPDDGGVPVMIDDALGWSDPQRLQSMGAAIATAGQQCQVVILTCTSGRYSYVGNAKVVSL